MRKFIGKCFSYNARDVLKIFVDVMITGISGFNIEKNKLIPRANEPNNLMPTSRITSVQCQRGRDNTDSRNLYVSYRGGSFGNTAWDRRHNE